MSDFEREATQLKIGRNTKIVRKTSRSRVSRTIASDGTHLVSAPAGEHVVSARLKQIVSWWFILQIVLPFTAPLQTLEFHDLFGRHGHRSQSLPESTTTPIMSESGAASAVAVMHSPSPVRAIVPTLAMNTPLRGPSAIVHVVSSSPQFQQSVLRL